MKQNNKFLDLLDSIKNSVDVIPDKNSNIMIVDGLNCFIRSFAIINHLNPNGHHIGGIEGFLKSMGYGIRLINPTKVIIIFDGEGSTTNKKNLYPEYKSNRNITRLTNWDIFSDKEEEKESLVNQILRLIEYLKNLPVSLLIIDKIEADDVIGHVINEFRSAQGVDKITIMSSDQDFLQLIDDKVQVYSPTKKKIYTTKEFTDEYKLIPQNYLTYKILRGDRGDNIHGVSGLGEIKIFKLFPELSGQQPISLDDIIKISADKREEHSLYNKIVVLKEQLETNKLLMDLDNPNIPKPDIDYIKSFLEQEPNKLNISKFLFMYNKDLLGNAIPNTHEWLINTFGYLNKFNK